MLLIQVLEARHDVQNAAKDGDVAALREAQKRLAVPLPFRPPTNANCTPRTLDLVSHKNNSTHT